MQIQLHRQPLATCAVVVLAFVGVLDGQTIGDTALAEVNGIPITAAEVDEALGQWLARLQEQVYALRRQKLEELIADRLISVAASSRKMSVQQFTDIEITAKVEPVTDQDIETFYQANKSHLQGQDEEILRHQIGGHLQKNRV